MSEQKPRSDKFEAGLKTRKAVLGDAYVDASIAATDDFTWPLQELVTEYCWDSVWNRDGLPRKTRSLINFFVKNWLLENFLVKNLYDFDFRE